LIFATGEAGCGKTWISAAKAAEALIHKDVERIIVTRPVLQADADFLSDGKIEAQLNGVIADLDAVRTEARQGSLLREGMKVVIAG
ncbi:PhoH family protein, partial [Salmonella enterica subsp. enterica serovar Anatum]|nr:PhoH family protein [Salmonella enterica subsp. enterica serovar Anatum]